MAVCCKKIDKWYASSKTCNICGYINKKLTLSECEWTFNKMVEELGSIETLKNDFISNVSHKFFQGDTSHAGAENGLGLALIWNVLELVGGYITVHSEVGKGTTFTVKLMVK